MTTSLCPHCGSDDLDLERGRCRNCMKLLDDTGHPSPPAEPHPTPSPSLDVRPIVPPREADSIASRLQYATVEGDWASWERQILNAYAEGFRIVTLIGFGSAGKTFFANRLRRELRLSSSWTVSPGEQATILLTDASINWTEAVRHHGRMHRYLLADVDGEAYRGSVTNLTGVASEKVWRRYVLLTALASAYFLVLPAREDLNQADDFKTETLVDRFDIIVGTMLALRQRIRKTTDVRDAIKEPITEEDLRKALREGIQCPQPVHVLFAQADTFKDVAKYDSDPYTYAMLHANSLYRTINKHFATHRFDFVSAFHGYQENHERLVDYRCPSYGTLAAFEWIDRMTSGGALSRKMTAVAKTARRLLDGSFRRNLLGTTGR